METNELYTLAKQKGITTHSIKCPKSKAISLELAGKKHIGIDSSVFKNEYTERLVLAHELSHALTNAYYDNLDNPINILRMETRANKKQIEMLIPKEKLDKILKECSSVFELAEYFSVPEELIKKAFWLYYKKQLP